ncbi:DUF1203 domain-containing protein [Streptomyces indicus]|uniref:DUF1203 domain-containing protein n=1 Tax=Streptomyces indicus TaxID=417292 RepID=A0A1G9DYW8_9ACTN|nr:DUF1203 domain-containing protein [Streptomyces indicus]SDK69065.1 Protein of unknown function [Streptomyces indicus]
MTTTQTVEIRAIDATVLKELRTRDDAGQLREPVTDTEGGAPLRCCLRRSTPGERITLVSYAPLRRWARETGAEPGPYDECGPVFIHADDCPGPPPGHSYPAALHGPRRVLRSYDADGRILGGRLIEIPREQATDMEQALTEALTDPAVAVVHVRAVEFGCFFMEVRRRA